MESAQDPCHILVAYGATLLLTAITDRYLFHLQLGDGDILTVSATTLAVERPFSIDKAMIGNETTSLCQDGAANLFRFHFHSFDDPPPKMIMVSTDGYSNAFASEADFLKVAADIFQLTKLHGTVFIEENIEAWLQNASEEGSGDDVTIALLFRDEGIKATSIPSDTNLSLSLG